MLTYLKKRNLKEGVVKHDLIRETDVSKKSKIQEIYDLRKFCKLYFDMKISIFKHWPCDLDMHNHNGSIMS